MTVSCKIKYSKSIQRYFHIRLDKYEHHNGACIKLSMGLAYSKRLYMAFIL